MKHTSSMAPRIRRRRARIAIFAAASLEQQNRCQDLLQRTRRSPDDVPTNELESRKHVAISSNLLQSVWGRLAPWKMEIKTGGVLSVSLNSRISWTILLISRN